MVYNCTVSEQEFQKPLGSINDICNNVYDAGGIFIHGVSYIIFVKFYSNWITGFTEDTSQFFMWFNEHIYRLTMSVFLS